LLVVIALAATVGIRLLPATSQSIDSVTVLPFTATGATGDIEYLTDGITETLINSLSQLSGLRVSARSVAFKYKGRDLDPQKIGKDLNVKAVITGRAAVRGGRLVIQADLVDVANGAQLWGGQYNRPLTDILAVQDQIAADIFDKLRFRLTGEDIKRATRRDTQNAEAYQLYLQGRFHWNKGTIAGYKKAIEYFQQAIDQDPKYAVAYAGLADSNLLLGTYWVEAIPSAKMAAEKALAIDPDLAEAHVALGHIKLWLDWDWPAAAREFTQGIALNPTSAFAHNEYAMYLAMLDRRDEAVAEGKRALEIEPLSPIINSDLGWALLYAGRHSEAVDQFRKTLELDQNSVAAHRGLGIEDAQAHRYDDAVSELRTALALSEGSPVIMGHLGSVYALKGAMKEAEDVLRDLQKLAEREYVPASAAALIYTARGETSRALQSLERAYEEHDFSMVQLRVAPWFEPLRGDPRFERLLNKVGVPRGSSLR
jgi:TolB-like protein/Flp pilus assembly protein TadD